MDNLKLKAIEYFAAKPHDDEKAKGYLKKVYEDIHEILIDSTSYDSMSTAFEVLDKFISHVASEAIEDLHLCWKQFKDGRKLVINDSSFSKYYTIEKIYSKIINLIGQLRYIEQEKVVSLLFQFWLEDKSSRDDIEKVFKELAGFNLHAVEQIGFTPQLKLLDVLTKLTNENKFVFFPILITAYTQFLSTDIEGHSWDYRTVSIKSMAIPGTRDIDKLRQNTLSSLVSMYKFASKPKDKKKLLNVMNSACSLWSRAPVSEEARMIVERNTVDVLQYWSSIVTTEQLELVQKIEHDSYWNYYHSSSQSVMNAALSVETAIKANEEYQVYRDLVGFKGIFSNWEDERNLTVDYENQRKVRDERINTHIESVTRENLEEWLSRMECYLETDSRDLATFPELFKFMEAISNRFPNEILSRFEETTRLDKSAIPIFRGVWSSSIRDNFILAIVKWIDSAKYLWELSVAFLSFEGVDLSLIERFLDKGIHTEDEESLSSFLRVLDTHRNVLSEEVVNQLFEKLFTFLNHKRVTIWINYIWFPQKGESFIQILSEKNVNLMISNLVFVNNVDHRVEGILEHIANKSISDIFYFFEQRIKYKKRRDNDPEDRYEDIPFSLHSINKVLAENPVELISLIKRNYNQNYGVSEFGTPSLFKKCFSTFEPQLIDLILENLKPSDDKELQLILSIVSSYKSHPSILPLVKRILIELDYDNKKIHWINLSLSSTGVVHGQYGFAEAYKNKLKSVEPWLNDDHVNVVKFARQYRDLLKELIEQEIKRVDERVAIEKHKYDINDSE